MSLRPVVAAPFRARGQDCLSESEFIVALSLDRDWFSPDQAARAVEVALERGLLERDGESLRAAFDPDGVEIPPDFVPDDALLRSRSPFEQVVEVLVAAGHGKREVVAAINRLQADTGVTSGAAAVLYARRQGVEVPAAVAAARDALSER